MNVSIIYEGENPLVFILAALSGGLGAVIGFRECGVVGAVLGGALGASLGGLMGAILEQLTTSNVGEKLLW